MKLPRWLIRRKLAKLMKPDPAYRQRRLAQFDPQRRARYFANVDAVLP